MKQIIQSYKTGELGLFDVPAAHADSFGHPAVFYSDSLPVVNL